MKLFDAISYNAGRGPADGNNYWRRFTAAHYAYVAALLAAFGLWTGTLAMMLTENSAAWTVVRAIPARPGTLSVWLFAVAAVFCLWFATGRAWIAALAGGLVTLAAPLASASDLTSAGAFFTGLRRGLTRSATNARLAAGTIVLGPVLLALAARGQIRGKKTRLIGALISAAVAAVAAALAAFFRG